MKKKLLLALSVFGMAMIPTHSANAILLKANDNEFANVGLKLAIWAQDNGKVTTNDHSGVNFSAENARLYFSGQINPIVQFGANIDFADNNALSPDGSARAHGGMPSTLVKDAFINLKFMPQAQLMAGLFLDPWSRVALGDLYSFIVPLENYNPGISEINVDGGKLLAQTGQNLTPLPNYTCNSNNTSCTFKGFINPLVPFTLGSDVGNSFRDAGIALWGDIGKDAMIKYYLMAGNGRYDYEAGHNGNNNLKYGFRIEFTPTMLGYKGTPGYVDEDTFLGKQNTLTFAFAYQQQKIDCSPSGNNPNPGGCGSVSGAPSSTTAKAYTFDVLWEQKFGDFVPNFQAAWLDQKDLGYAKAGTTVAQPEAQGYYLQTQLLYDRYVGIGKPALVLRYENDENKNYYTYNNSFVTGKVSMTDIFFNYYIDGENANISLGAQIVSPNSDLKNATANGNNQLKSFTDWTLALRTVF
ncbi:MAG: short chain amide porin [Hydrogenobaculum sp.]